MSQQVTQQWVEQQVGMLNDGWGFARHPAFYVWDVATLQQEAGAGATTLRLTMANPISFSDVHTIAVVEFPSGRVLQTARAMNEGTSLDLTGLDLDPAQALVVAVDGGIPAVAIDARLVTPGAPPSQGGTGTTGNENSAGAVVSQLGSLIVKGVAVIVGVVVLAELVIPALERHAAKED